MYAYVQRSTIPLCGDTLQAKLQGLVLRTQPRNTNSETGRKQEWETARESEQARESERQTEVCDDDDAGTGCTNTFDVGGMHWPTCCHSNHRGHWFQMVLDLRTCVHGHGNLYPPLETRHRVGYVARLCSIRTFSSGDSFCSPILLDFMVTTLVQVLQSLPNKRTPSSGLRSHFPTSNLPAPASHTCDTRPSCPCESSGCLIQCWNELGNWHLIGTCNVDGASPSGPQMSIDLFAILSQMLYYVWVHHFESSLKVPHPQCRRVLVCTLYKVYSIQVMQAGSSPSQHLIGITVWMSTLTDPLPSGEFYCEGVAHHLGPSYSAFFSLWATNKLIRSHKPSTQFWPHWAVY